MKPRIDEVSELTLFYMNDHVLNFERVSETSR
jgi:hypothetical protein